MSANPRLRSRLRIRSQAVSRGLHCLGINNLRVRAAVRTQMAGCSLCRRRRIPYALQGQAVGSAGQMMDSREQHAVPA